MSEQKKHKFPAKAVILAGGKGTRLYPITLEIPKPLIPVKKKPIINYLVELLAEHGIKEIKVVIREADQEDFHWWKKRFETQFGNSLISFAVETEPMGTLGYIYHHLGDWLGEEPFFLTNADELKRFDLLQMRDFHLENKGLATIALVEVENPSDFGVAVMDNHKITQFLEKPQNPPSSFISSGFYMVSPRAFSHIDDSRRDAKFLMIEKDLFPHLAQKGLLLGFKSDSYFFGCDNFERLEKAIKFFNSQ